MDKKPDKKNDINKQKHKGGNKKQGKSGFQHLKEEIQDVIDSYNPDVSHMTLNQIKIIKHRRRKKRIMMCAVAGIVLVLLIVLIVVAVQHGHKAGKAEQTGSLFSKQQQEEDLGLLSVEEEVSDSPQLWREDADVISFNPHCTDATDPSTLIANTSIAVNGELVESYEAGEQISFGKGSDYTNMPGIVTFRGNNYRNNPTYGLAEFSENTLSSVWSNPVGALSHNGNAWTGTGWTGQPLMMQWPDEVKQHMNMYDSAKAKDGLVEVIYATMDGNVYFYDLETGEATRDPLYLGYTFKGSGALDPRGYPIMYVGAGIDSDYGVGRVFVVNLLDCSVMTTFGDNDPFRLREINFFDSSALVDAETDTLIYPGENGILYLVHLNTQYDPDAGTLSIDPEYTKWNYQGTRSNLNSYWLGMEDSAATYDGYLFIADNGGNLMCINLNTLKLVWVQDILDDTNCSPVLSVEDGKLYLYISTSFHYGWRSTTTATIPIWKIDAETGEIVWQQDYECYTEDGVSGGVQSTMATGVNELSDYIYVTVSRTGSGYGGVLACLEKATGEMKWEHEASYAWSSPVCVYNAQGEGNVLYASSMGKLYMLDGLTGETYDTLELSEGTIESSPAVYDDMLVIGTRAGKVWGVQIR